MMSGAWIALFVSLWAVVLLLLLLVLGLIRQVALLKTPASGSQAPPKSRGYAGVFPARNVAWVRSSAEGTDSRRARILVFLSSGCGACRRVASEFGDGDQRERARRPAWDAIDLIVVTDAQGSQQFASLRPTEVLIQATGEVSHAWDVPGTPFAVAIDVEGVVRDSGFVREGADIHALAAMLAADSIEPSSTFAADARRL
jgi:hypothetical protein